MEIVFLPAAKNDLDFWVKAGNKSLIKKITELILSIQKDPYSGIGKPEQLKYNLSGVWSRRINNEHRLVYEIIDNKILIHSAKGHYNQ